MEKRPPAIVGVWTGRDRSPCLLSTSLWGTRYQRKLSFQLNPPQVMSEAGMYSKFSSLMTSMMGQTTLVRSSTILAIKGSNHPTVHSQWASRKVMTWPLDSAAPINRALISPDRFPVRSTFTGTLNFETYSSSSFPKWSVKRRKEVEKKKEMSYLLSCKCTLLFLLYLYHWHHPLKESPQEDLWERFWWWSEQFSRELTRLHYGRRWQLMSREDVEDKSSFCTCR